uniref:Histidine--tRNA ligase, chloroplastic n=1 Tax=Chondria tumulosa TaxID=2740715 RepID=A0A896SRG2_9FLOR|nr:histidine-tRNA ligase [Chondria tumulosa]QSD57197.1 histidine-tRNA ligase [Chondria tumulosa]
MQPLRGTKDILPTEIIYWQKIYEITKKILTTYNYHEVRTPIIESTELFLRSIGNFTDIINKEMYNFNDQRQRRITLRPEGTAGIARAVISNKLYLSNKISKLWYLGPMFRYERPQRGRQRQFHQLGIECIGSSTPMADIEVIRLAIRILQKLKFTNWVLEVNSIGNSREREKYINDLVMYLNKYYSDLDKDSQKRLIHNPLRILDSKNLKTQEILIDAPKLKNYLTLEALNHFNEICDQLCLLNIKYKINDNLVRGLDYYNDTAFEIKTKNNNQQNTICGGGRYDELIQQLGGPHIPSVGWAIGIERLITTIENTVEIEKKKVIIYIINLNIYKSDIIWKIVKIIEIYQLQFEIDLSNTNLNKQLKRANQIGSKLCFIIGNDEINNQYITIKWLETSTQQKISILHLQNYLKYLKNYLDT